jgi:hypothetical protein
MRDRDPVVAPDAFVASIVHTGARLPDRARVGMRQFAVPGPDGVAVVTSDLDEARELLAAADFFGRVFAERINRPYRTSLLLTFCYATLTICLSAATAVTKDEIAVLLAAVHLPAPTP